MITFSQGVANLPNQYPLAEWWDAHWHTQLIELPVYMALLCWAFGSKERTYWWLPIPLSVLVNVITHPVLWYWFPYWDPGGRWLEPLIRLVSEDALRHPGASWFAWLAIAETCVFLVEGHIVALALSLWGKESFRPAPRALAWGVLVAFLANVPSTLWGLLQ